MRQMAGARCAAAARRPGSSRSTFRMDAFLQHLDGVVAPLHTDSGAWKSAVQEASQGEALTCGSGRLAFQETEVIAGIAGAAAAASVAPATTASTQRTMNRDDEVHNP